MGGVADLALLHALDESDVPESPPGFDWRRAEQGLRAMARDLAGALGVPALDVEGPESVQDASFHGQVVLPAPALSPGQPGPAILCTSNFGRLAAVRPEGAVRRRPRPTRLRLRAGVAPGRAVHRADIARRARCPDVVDPVFRVSLAAS